MLPTLWVLKKICIKIYSSHINFTVYDMYMPNLASYQTFPSFSSVKFAKRFEQKKGSTSLVWFDIFNIVNIGPQP